MKVGILGCGVIAREHIRAIEKVRGARIVALADSNETALAALAAKVGVEKTYTDPRALLEKERPDAVHVVTPPSSHEALARAALDAGCHVFLEKPMTLRAPEAERLVELAARVGRLLCVDHNHRFDRVMIEAQELVRRGVIGSLVSIDSYYGFDLGTTPGGRYFTEAYSHWAYSLPGGLLHNGLDHPLSVVMPFMKPPRTVLASAAIVGVLPDGIPGELKILLNDGHLVASVTLSEAASPRFHYLHLHGSRGTLQVDLQNKRILRFAHRPGVPHYATRALMNLNQGFRVLTGTLGTFYKVLRGRFSPYEGQQHLIAKFYEAIEAGAPSPLPPQDALTVTRIMDEVWNQIGDLGPPRDAPPLEKWAPGRKVSLARSGSGPRVLVTGATGFIGSHLVRRLVADGRCPVRALVRNLHKAAYLRDLPVEVVLGDLSDEQRIAEALKGVGAVYHLGAAMRGTWSDYEEATIRGTERLVAASLAAGVEAFVHASSIAVYGVPSLPPGERIREDAAYASGELTDYIRSKIEAERRVLGAVTEHSLPATILRLGVVFGPGRPHISRLGYRFGPRFHVVVGLNNVRIPSVYIDDAVDAFLLAAERPEARGKIYNVVDDPRFTQLDYLRKMSEHGEGRSYYVFFPYTVASLAGSLARRADGRNGTMKRVAGLLSPFHLKSCATDLLYDNARLKSELGWQPSGRWEEHLRATFSQAT